MLNCQQAKEQFSDYYDGALDVNRADMQTHLAGCPSCAAEYRSLARTIEMIRAIPAEEPVLDLWPEFVPQLDAFEAEQKLGLRERLRRNWLLMMARLSEGIILYTTHMAQRASRGLGKYLIYDPFAAKE